MIIACPACATRYVVPDSAIGVDGRTVRCAKCRHSWFQDGQPAERVIDAAPPQSPPPAPPPPPPSPPEPAVAEPDPTEVAPAQAPLQERETAFAPQGLVQEPERVPAEAEPAPADEAEPAPPPAYSPPEPEVPAYAAPAHDNAVDVVYEQSPSSFEYEPPFRPRRNPAKLWTAAAVAFALLAAAVIGAVSWWGIPDWVPIARPTFGAAQPDLVLEFPPERQDRRTLPNGTEFFGASGTVTNVGQETRDLPPILIVLRDARERIVYTWEVRAPKPALAPGESVTINEAVTDVPKSAKVAEIGWKP